MGKAVRGQEVKGKDVEIECHQDVLRNLLPAQGSGHCLQKESECFEALQGFLDMAMFFFYFFSPFQFPKLEVFNYPKKMNFWV